MPRESGRFLRQKGKRYVSRFVDYLRGFSRGRYRRSHHLAGKGFPLSEKTIIEVRRDPRQGLFPNLRQYRAACLHCEWKSRWFNYEANADEESRRAHVTRQECP
jgi:hypothetical protein